MIGDTTLDSGYGSGLTVDGLAAANLRKAGKWARFLGIVTMVSIGIGVILLVLFGGTFLALALGSGGEAVGGAMTGILIVYGVIFALFFYLTYLLYNFGAKAVATVDRGDTVAMAEAFASLSRLLKIFGIFTIIQLLFTAIAFIGIAVGGGLAAADSF
ncbi:hypothetical protein LEM8419_01803 [Neolewinella maritima]|uniref:Uncharacterized protein n=1 Tax=Neolewinella maritima TaxID=1383882 RepID=A0ABN8F863_9BACT|nr:hypothetical protein [Neolewinella maritima]CAH1000669.1 hypothetical protein LEM8419_01803 [Neolewinella maritima]